VPATLRKQLLWAGPCAVLALLTMPTLGARSLWYDEAWIANVILRGRLTPTELGQTPLGFAALASVSVGLLGSSEWAFRLLPAVFALVAVWLTYRVGRTAYDSPLVGFIAAALLATNLRMVAYARTLKPYTGDMLWSLLLITLADLIRREGSWQRWAVYGVALVLGPLFSFPALFVGAVASALLCVVAVQRGRQQTVRAVAIHAVACITLGAYGLLFLQWQRSDRVETAWGHGFPPLADPVSLTAWYTEQLSGLLVHLYAPWLWREKVDQVVVGAAGLGDGAGAVVGAATVAVSAAAISGGVVLSARRQPSLLLLLLGPLTLVAILAAVITLYPFSGTHGGQRVLLFALPSLALLQARGLAPVIRSLARGTPPGPSWRLPFPAERGRDWGRERLLWMVLAVTTVPAFYTVLFTVTTPLQIVPTIPPQELRPLAGLLRERVAPGDLIYVTVGVSHPFELYLPEYRRPDRRPRQQGLVSHDGVTVVYSGLLPETYATLPAQIEEEIRSHAPRRLWLVHQPEAWAGQSLSMPPLQCGTVGFTATAPGTMLVLFDIAAPSEQRDTTGLCTLSRHQP
jgi:hypothetical protein